MKTIVGIDLGTTYSGVAHLTPDGPRMIPNALGESLTPSVVGIDHDGGLLVGRAALELQVTEPTRCASVFKRHMGSDWTTRLIDQEFSPEQLSSLVLRTLKRDAEEYLGCRVEHAVITVPAYFNERQRRATLQAGKMADLTVERIVNEPTAAAIAYGLHESRQEKTVLVFDLGGGTFDVSIVDMFEGVVEVRASSGDSFLGGEDFTTAMAARVLESRGYVLERAELELPRLVSRVMQQCEAAKRRLSAHLEARIRIPDEQGRLSDDSPEVVVTRAEFCSWTNHVLSRLELPMRRALVDAGLKSDDLSEVILVGGATRMPAVVQWLVARLGKEPQCRLNPDEVVALGSAVQAGLVARDESLRDLVVTDICPFTLGIETSKDLGGKRCPGYFAPIIHRNMPLPTSRVECFGTVNANQTQIRVAVYQGENRRVEKNVQLGEFLVDGIPAGPPRDAVDIRFTYDLNGVLEVEATVVETKETICHVITRHAHGLTPEQVAQAVADMAALKQHPRDETVNRFLLRRADRVFGELPLREQQRLGQLLDGFEAALELRDPHSIEMHRNAIRALLEQAEGNPPDEAFDD